MFRRFQRPARCALALSVGLLFATSAALAHDDEGHEGRASAKGACDARLAVALRNDRDATVLLAKSFKAGEPVALANSPTNPPPAPVDMCLVKVLVGPGNPGTEGAPSTSKGIGIEVWLPSDANWNGIIRAFGSGGWAGGTHADVTRIGRTGAADVVQLGAVARGYAISSSDHGHAGNLAISTNRDASFAMREDGTINTTLWHDFAERSMHEMALKTKAIVRAYYGHAQRYAYWDGFSTGGRQGYKIAQRYPRDFDGILAGAPAFNWTRFITAELYPQLAMLRELGGPIAPARLNAVSAAANRSCGGAVLGFQVDPFSCHYDPSRDAAALCAGVTGRGVVGTNADAASCVSLAEADVVNRIWYGQTTDGSHADPLVDNGGGPLRNSSRHLWFGLTRGATLASLAGTPPFPIASTQVALELQDPRYAQSDKPYLVNATGNGQDKWKELDYAGLAHAYQRGLDLQPFFSRINTDDADLRDALHAGTKVLSYHGLADDLIMPQGSANYFVRAAAEMGGVERLQRFNRLFFIPGLAHDSTFARAGSIDPATGAATSPDKVPLPQPATGRDELFTALRQWVEHGVAPERIDVSSRNGSVSMPLCLYPTKATHDGQGPVTSAASYACR
jgi:feruloyl esterase